MQGFSSPSSSRTQRPEWENVAVSIKIMTQVWDMALPGTEKLVMLALADAASDEGACWPMVATIAKKCGISERTVFRVADKMREAGHISWEPRRNHSNLWRIHPQQVSSQ